jgi:general secretion pathway protein L
MSNRIIAVDLGAWSVKVAIAQPGLRHAMLTAFVERAVPPAEPGSADEAWEARAARVLADIAREYRLEHDNVYLGLPGDHVFSHVLEFGFKNLRRAELEKAVGAELEGVVPIDLEDMVFAFEPLPPDEAPMTGPEAEAAPGRVAAPTTGMRVLTYAMARAKAQTWLELATRAGAQPRGLIPEAGPAARLVERAPSLADARARGPVAVVDVGHVRTDVVVVRGGKPVYARTVGRGGKHVTDMIARHWRLAWTEAERAKHSDGFIASSTLPAQSEAWARVSEVVRAELVPFARDLRQSLAACRAKTGVTPASILLVGGGSRLRGLDHFLAEQLGLPVVMLGATDVESMVGAKVAGQVSADSGALAIGMVADAGTGRPMLDLRTGPLAAKVDLSFVRARAGWIASAVILIAFFATLSGFASHYRLRKAQKILTERLAVESAETLGTPQTADQVLNGATAGATAAVSPLPKMTAWDILLDITNRLPGREKVTLDVESIDIDSSKVTIKGTAKTPDEVDLIEAALKAQTCFTEVNRGALEQLADGKRKFDFTIKAACM